MSDRLIVENRTNRTMWAALQYVLEVVKMGRISGEASAKGAQYCYHTAFNDGIQVAAFKNKLSDRLVVYEEKPND